MLHSMLFSQCAIFSRHAHTDTHSHTHTIHTQNTHAKHTHLHTYTRTHTTCLNIGGDVCYIKIESERANATVSVRETRHAWSDFIYKSSNTHVSGHPLHIPTYPPNTYARAYTDLLWRVLSEDVCHYAVWYASPPPWLSTGSNVSITSDHSPDMHTRTHTHAIAHANLYCVCVRACVCVSFLYIQPTPQGQQQKRHAQWRYGTSALFYQNTLWFWRSPLPIKKTGMNTPVRVCDDCFITIKRTNFDFNI